MVKQSLAFDSLGTRHTMSQYFVKTGTGQSTCITASMATRRRPTPI